MFNLFALTIHASHRFDLIFHVHVYIFL
jgi:hypothetical protein